MLTCLEIRCQKLVSGFVWQLKILTMTDDKYSMEDSNVLSV